MSTFTLVPEQSDSDMTLPCATDLSTKIYLLMKVVSDLIVTAGAGERTAGILQNTPVGSTSRHAGAAVRTSGLSKLKLGVGGATAGAFLKADASGQGIVASTGDIYGAQALSAGVAGDLIAVRVVTGTAP